MEDKILISSGWCRVRRHHKLTDQSKSISHDLDPFWLVKTLFNAVSTKIFSHLFRYDSETLVNFMIMCCRNMGYFNWYTSIRNVMPHLLVPGTRYPVSLLEPFKTLVFVITQLSCWQKEGVSLQTSNLEISYSDTRSAENYLKEVLHINSEKLRTIRITQVKADLRLFGVLAFRT